jgi:hypothetical protein
MTSSILYEKVKVDIKSHGGTKSVSPKKTVFIQNITNHLKMYPYIITIAIDNLKYPKF